MEQLTPALFQGSSRRRFEERHRRRSCALRRMWCGPTSGSLCTRTSLRSRRDWREFEARADGTVFQTYEWLSTWQRHIGAPRGARPAIVIGRDAHGEIMLLLPLAIERTRLARRLTWLGSELCDYNAPLLATDFSLHVSLARFRAALGRYSVAPAQPSAARFRPGPSRPDAGDGRRSAQSDAAPRRHMPHPQPRLCGEPWPTTGRRFTPSARRRRGGTIAPSARSSPSTARSRAFTPDDTGGDRRHAGNC